MADSMAVNADHVFGAMPAMCGPAMSVPAMSGRHPESGDFVQWLNCCF